MSHNDAAGFMLCGQKKNTRALTGVPVGFKILSVSLYSGFFSPPVAVVHCLAGCSEERDDK